MKVERWEEESDEEWAERLEEEMALANATETTQYFVELDPYDEENFIINYIGEDRWTWKEHPEGPFTCKQILEWKLKAERWDEMKPIWDKATDELMRSAYDLQQAQKKLEAIKTFAEAMAPSYMSQRILDLLQSSDISMIKEVG